LRVPDGTDWVYLFDLLTSSAVPGPNPEFEARMRARNRALFEKARLMGGVRYPIGTLPFDHEDWKHHYGNAAAKFADLKHRFDPSGVLTPGPGIF
jgi:FAD/FMN-containing dehydrogenase